MTYSILACDPAADELGVAGFTGSPFVGAKVPWARAGVGAVATQANTERDFGPAGLRLLEAGVKPRAAIDELLKLDPNRDERQLAIIDRRGNVAVHTGSKTIREAGHLEGQGFSVQANMMLYPNVWENSATAYSQAKGSLAERLLTAMTAVEQAGGDLREARSCAIRIVKTEAPSETSNGAILDIRVDDHPAPLEEMRRLVTKQLAYAAADAAITKIESGDFDGALESYSEAIELQPEELQLRIWGWIPLILADQDGQINRVADLLGPLLKADRKWARLLRRYGEVRPLRTPGLMEQFEALAGPRHHA